MKKNQSIRGDGSKVFGGVRSVISFLNCCKIWMTKWPFIRNTVEFAELYLFLTFNLLLNNGGPAGNDLVYINALGFLSVTVSRGVRFHDCHRDARLCGKCDEWVDARHCVRGVELMHLHLVIAQNDLKCLIFLNMTSLVIFLRRWLKCNYLFECICSCFIWYFLFCVQNMTTSSFLFKHHITPLCWKQPFDFRSTNIVQTI